MTEEVFVTFNVWTSHKGLVLDKKSINNVAVEHFIDIKDTFDLSEDASMREVSVRDAEQGQVYRFEILVPVGKRSH